MASHKNAMQEKKIYLYVFKSVLKSKKKAVIELKTWLKQKKGPVPQYF